MLGYICDTCGRWVAKLTETHPDCHHPRVTMEEHFTPEEILTAKLKTNPDLDWINEDELCQCLHEHWRHLNVPAGEPTGRPDGPCAVCETCPEFTAA